MSYAVHSESFEGPLDLLLQLVESAELEITNVSLMQVTEPFVEYVRANQGKIPPEELADFLIVAAKLVYLKSKALLPDLQDSSLEEGPDLATQLKMYQAFVVAATKIGALAREAHMSYSRQAPRATFHVSGTEFVPPASLNISMLHDLYARVIRRLEPLLALPKAAIERVISLEEKIADLSLRIKKTLKLSFYRVLAESRDRMEMVVSFLALLELIKQRTVAVEQGELFQDISLRAGEENGFEV
jgi:segregation and condensation protein A